MHPNAIGSNSDGNSLHTALISHGYSDRQTEKNHVMSGFPVPLTLGEAMSNLANGQMTNSVSIANPNEFWNVQSGRDSNIRDFSASFPQNNSNFQDPDQFMEGIPLPYVRFGNQEKFTTPIPSAYPLEYSKTTFPNNPSTIFENLNYGYENLPLDTNSRWEFNKIVNPPEIVGRGLTEQNGHGPSSSNEWIVTEQGALSSTIPSTSRFSNELSLSLATSQTHQAVHGASMSSSGFSLDKRQSEHASCSNSNLSLSFNSYKPLQFSPLLSGSKFFQAVQEILAEIACYALENFDQMSYLASGIDNGGVNRSFSSGRGSSDIIDFDEDQRLMFERDNPMQERDVEAKKKQLLALLQVVDDRYNQCLDEIHTVVSAFHAVTELDPNLHARFALPTLSFMYKNLRERISSHILAMGPNPREEEAREDKSFETSFIRKQWALQQLRKKDHHLWRPQRGLPERSVSVLRAWMFQNFLHPYPKDAEKHLLALRSGLTRSQVSNWFINARVRLWKPMIEEMYAEMNRRKARRNEEETEGNHRNYMRFEERRFTMN